MWHCSSSRALRVAFHIASGMLRLCHTGAVKHASVLRKYSVVFSAAYSVSAQYHVLCTAELNSFLHTCFFSVEGGGGALMVM